jgi:hypothetical protein
MHVVRVCSKLRSEPRYILIVFAAVFFFVYSYPSLISPAKFVSPDENINHFFSEYYSENGELSYYDELNEIANGIIRPRNTVDHDGYIAPQKFVGFLVVDGALAVLLPEIVRFLTPLLAVIGALFLYLLVRDVFNERIAAASSLLLFIVSPYWYWSSMAMFENVAGCVMLIISLRYFFRLLSRANVGDYLLAGLFLGLALFIRPEYVLLAVPLFVILLANRCRIRKTYACLAVLSLAAAVGPLLLLNDSLYGSFLVTGHHLRYEVSEPISVGSFSPLNVVKNSLVLAALTPPLFILSLMGFLSCVRQKIHLHYVLFFTMCLLSLSLYFLGGNVGPVDVHGSYVRYLLPVYVLSLPLIAHCILGFKSRIAILLVCSILAFSLPWVVLKIDSNVDSARRYSRISTEVAQATEENAVIFLEYWDKAVFPQRKVALVRWLPEGDRPVELCRILTELEERDTPTYVFLDKRFLGLVSQSALDENLLAKGYELAPTGVQNLCSVDVTQLQ